MSEDEVYEKFLDIMFTEFTRDEMEYCHHVQRQAIEDEADGHA